MLLGTFDTKGREYSFLRERLAALGVQCVLVDAGVYKPVGVTPDVTNDRVAEAGGSTRAELMAAGRGAAVEAMARGATRVVSDLLAEGRLDGIVALGGSGGSAVATAAMRDASKPAWL